MFDKNKTKGIPLNRTPENVGIAAFNLSTIERLLDSKGIIAFHVKHMLNPVRQNLLTGEHLNTNNLTYKYYDIRPIRVVPQSMSSETMIMQYSVDQQFTKVMLNIGGYYLDKPEEKDRVMVRSNDLFILNPTITMLNQTCIEAHNGTLFGLPQYVNRIEHMEDDLGNVYAPDIDVFVVNGKIQTKEPVVDRIFSIVYEHPIIYNVESIPHYIRILQANAGGSGSQSRDAVYAPQLVFANFISVLNFGEAVYDWFRSPIVENYQDYFNKGRYN